MNKASLYVPLGIFSVIVAIFYVGFSLEDRHVLPSALLDKPFPEFSSTDLYQRDRVITREDIVGQPTLVNVWATWCPTCKAEHEMLMQIARETGNGLELRLVGVNYKDNPAKAMRWLADFGNPYDLILEDRDGRLGVELGVYGAPETFLLNAEGNVVYKRVGDVNERIWLEEIRPRLLVMMDS